MRGNIWMNGYVSQTHSTPTTNQTIMKNALIAVIFSVTGAWAQNGDQGIQNPHTSAFPTIVGNTTYDLQTNLSSCHRIYQFGGQVGCIWTRSTMFNPSFIDRGTGYNHYDGMNWDAIPAGNIDTIAWSNIDMGAGFTEYVLGHRTISNINNLALLKRSPAGTGSWTTSWLPPHPGGNLCLWPKMRVGGITSNSIHVIALTSPVSNGGFTANGINGALTYSRSQDGGTTWDLVHVALPLIDSVHYKSMRADSYSIDVNGNTVAIVQGSRHNDWILWKSTDNGTTWVRTVIQAFPIAAYDEAGMTTDVNGDAIADTIDHIDGAQAVVIDNNDMAHCFTGRMRVLQTASDTILVHFPKTDGLLYWNESIGGNGPSQIAGTEDIDGSGQFELPDGMPAYGVSMTSMPTAGVDGGSNIFLAYSGVIENTTNGHPDPAQEQPFRNIYCMYSPDNGNSWSVPVRLEPSDFDESIYPSMARNVDAQIHLLWQVDVEPGSALTEIDPIGANDIWHYAEDPSVLFSGIQVVPFNYLKLRGTVYFDQNQNGSRDPGDYGMTGFTLQRAPAGIYSQTNNLGNYLFIADSGWHTVSVLYNTDWQVTSDSTSYAVYLNTLTMDSLDFGMYPVNNVYQLETTLTSSIPRCNNYVHFYIHYTNTGTVPTSGTVRFIMDPQLVMDTVSPPYTTYSNDTIEWTFANLMPFEQRSVHVTTTSFGLTIGDTIFNCGQVLYDNGLSGGVSEECEYQEVVCSWDPNDKAVKPEGVDVPHYTLLTDTLVYTIRFQNTGNDTAFVVRVRDTLDVALNPATFRFKASSHLVDITHGPNGAMLFTFNNILLPDSATDEPGSNGFIKYSVRPYANTPVGTEVYNTAHIFFDYNPPIITNTTFNTLVDVIGLSEPGDSESQLEIFPNPVQENAVIRFSGLLPQNNSIVIYDVNGKTMMKKLLMISNQTVLNTADLSQGVYHCVLYNESGIAIGRTSFVVQHGTPAHR